MNVTVEILGRATMDAPFLSLAAPIVLAMPEGPLGFTPAIPEGTEGQDLRLKVTLPGTVTADVGQWLDPALRPPPSDLFDKDGNVVGQSPGPAPTVQKSFCSLSGKPLMIEFRPGASFRFRRSGAAA